MRASTKDEKKKTAEREEPLLRRSDRERKQPKNDYFLMGTSQIQDVLGLSSLDDDLQSRRRRKNYRYDDSEEYEEGHRYSKKKQLTTNKVEALLEWKDQITEQQVTINSFTNSDQPVPLNQLCKVKNTKSIVNENLSSFGEDIQALFININWGKRGQTIKDFANLKIHHNKLMSRGLVFLWAPKELISQVLNIMEKKDFSYVQNLEIINLDLQKAKLIVSPGNSKKITKIQSSSTLDKKEENAKEKEEQSEQTEALDLKSLVKMLDGVDPSDLIAQESSPYFNRSKRTLLIFRKASNIKIELRHQRTCDVIFDMPVKLSEKCAPDIKGYIYNMIQTLLPECLVINEAKKNDFQFKMMELWADRHQPRRGWISVVQE